mgnify:CR=1 FL=1
MHSHLAVPSLYGGMLDRLSGLGTGPSVVDQNIETTEYGHCFVDCGGPFGLLSYIQVEKQCVVSFTTYLVHRPSSKVVVDVSHNDLGTFAGE